MLKQRLITAFTLGPLSIWAILSLPSEIFAVIIAVFIIMGAWEWARFIGAISMQLRFSYCAVLGVILYTLWSLMSSYVNEIVYVLSVAAIWWSFASVFVLFYPRLTDIWGNKTIKALSGYLVLIPCWMALVYMHTMPMFGAGYTLFVIMLMWFADSAAYFGGKQWGKNKLAQRVSPGKTLEGVYAALLVSVIYILIAGYLLDYVKAGPGELFKFLCLSLFVVLVSIVGDLTESMFKRQSGVKDSGSLLPGHGGVLDRIDSLTAAAPVFTLGLIWWKGLLTGPIVTIKEVLP